MILLGFVMGVTFHYYFGDKLQELYNKWFKR